MEMGPKKSMHKSQYILSQIRKADKRVFSFCFAGAEYIDFFLKSALSNVDN